MKLRLVLLAMLFIGLSFSIRAQTDRSGFSVFLLGQSGVYVYQHMMLGQIDTLLTGQYTDIDIRETTPHGLLAVANDSLFLAPGIWYPDPFRDTVPGVFAQNVCMCDSFILVGSKQAPYVRAFEFDLQGLSPAFTLDTAKIGQTPQHMACHDGKVYAAVGHMGPMRLEWGYVIDPLPDEDPSNWEFSMGGSF